MAAYRLVNSPSALGWVQRTADGAFIPPDPRNSDRQEYDRWVADDNTPDPAG